MLLLMVLMGLMVAFPRIPHLPGLLGAGVVDYYGYYGSQVYYATRLHDWSKNRPDNFDNKFLTKTFFGKYLKEKC